ncbi:prepilin peptidase [Thermincola potens]|uniref:Prepilin leader peptidase/N-methyltransferase n=1 Tax=Thermincola potens (strain JR) TaxID=635013 RepID=D5X7M9_THEPJ|nr:A24 family peptidase [Thermincola potens]ADG82599.1 peptidase A24A domain protein [Thermincola potens JR]
MNTNIFLFSLLGIIIGSFLNVCIYRIPQQMSVINPPSHCPDCGNRLKPLHLIPVISFLMYKGRCAYCGTKISWQYPLVELLTGLLYGLTVYRFGLTAEAVVYLVLISLLIVISFIDLRLKIIPNGLIIIGLVVGLAINIIRPLTTFSGGLVGFFSAGCLFLAIAVLSKGGMGGGDIKLAAMLGLWLGWQQAFLGFFLAFLSGTAVGIGLMATGQKSRKDAIPFGPFISLGALLSIFWSRQIIGWYMAHFL